MTIPLNRRPFAKHVFLGEIQYQSRFAANAAKRLVSTGQDSDPIETWGAVQSILTAAGNVSRILWPSRRAYAARGEMLRAILGIGADSALADRSVRNHFEHYDERLEEWLATSNSAGFVDQLIGSPSGYERGFPKKVHRSYDPLTHALTFQGESINLGAILKALDEIRHKCQSIKLV